MIFCQLAKPLLTKTISLISSNNKSNQWKKLIETFIDLARFFECIGIHIGAMCQDVINQLTVWDNQTQASTQLLAWFFLRSLSLLFDTNLKFQPLISMLLLVAIESSVTEEPKLLFEICRGTFFHPHTHFFSNTSDLVPCFKSPLWRLFSVQEHGLQKHYVLINMKIMISQRNEE